MTASPAVAAAPISTVACGDTVTGSVKLVRDLACSDPAIPALTLTSGASVNLNGRSIRYTGPADQAATGIAVYSTVDVPVITDVTVRNGRIVGYDNDPWASRAIHLQDVHGVTLSGLTVKGAVEILRGADATLRDSRVTGGVSFEYATRPVVRNSRIDANGYPGAALNLLAANPRVVNNDVRAGGLAGIVLRESNFPEGGVIRNNQVRDASSGILLDWYTAHIDVSGNRVSRSQIGIDLGNVIGDLSVRGNTITDVGQGIALTGVYMSGPTTVVSNSIQRVAGDGVRIVQSDSAVPVTISGNDVRSTGGQAIHAPGATGEANTVRRIGTNPPCDGPQCR